MQNFMGTQRHIYFDDFLPFLYGELKVSFNTHEEAAGGIEYRAETAVVWQDFYRFD